MIDLAILLAFVAYAIISGFRARKQAGKNLEEYFLAGRTLPGWKAGTSMAATQFAADTPLLVTGLIATAGIFACWRLWIYGIAFLMMGFLFARMWRRAGVLTDAELTELRYSGRGALWLRGAKAVYYGTIFNCVVMAMVLIATVRICEVFLPWHEWLPAFIHQPIVSLAAFGGFNLSTLPAGDPNALIYTANSLISIAAILTFVALYSTTGGLRSVVNTDFGQFLLMMAGTALYAGFVWWEVGESGIAGGLMANDPERAGQILAFGFPADANLGMEQGLYAFLTIIGLQWFFQINSDGTGYLAQRAMACRSDGDAKQAGVLFAWLQIFLRSIFWLVIGLGLLVLYPAVDGVAAREMTFVHGIDDLLPVGARGVMLTALLAALASTIDSHLNWGASYWSNDFYKRIVCETWQRRDAGDRELVWVARASNLLLIAIALIIMVNISSIQEAWTISLIFGAGMGAVLVLRWLWERVSLWSELGAIGVSIIVAPFAFFFLETDWARMLAMAVASTVATLAGAYLARTDPATLQAFYKRVKPVGFWSHTARECGDDPALPRRAFNEQALATVAASVSLFGALYGVGKLMFHLPTQTLWLAWGSLLIAAVLTPCWWRKLV